MQDAPESTLTATSGFLTTYLFHNESTQNETVLVGEHPCIYCVPAAQRMRKIDEITSTWDARDIIANRVRDGICRVCLH